MIKSFSFLLIFLTQAISFPCSNSGGSNQFSGFIIDSVKALHDLSSVRRDSSFYKDSTGFYFRDSSGIWRKDTLSLYDSLGHLRKNIAKRDTIAPIFQSPLSNENYILTSDNLRKNDYSFTPDYFKLFEYSYLAGTGNLGAPDELYLYGSGTDNINYLRDGIPLNSLPQIQYNLNYIQSESIDSIEIIPTPRGFLYGNYNKPVSVNLISKDFISINPYTRIKYYQGAFGEAMVDGIYNAVLYKKLFSFLDITNRKLDQRYINSDFSSWQVTAKLRYLFSNSVNITGTYTYSKIYKALNGGVNIDTVLKNGATANSFLYQELDAPVVYQLTDMDVTQHFFGLRLLAKPLVGANTDFNIYYKFDGQSLNNIADQPALFDKTKNKTSGISLNQKYQKDIFNFNLITGYEHSDVISDRTDTARQDFKFDLFSFSFTAGIKLSDKMIASVFGKYSLYRINNPLLGPVSYHSTGIGADINIKITDESLFYLGYSYLDGYYSDKYFGDAEASVIYSSGNLYLKLSSFTKNNRNILYPGYFLTELPAYNPGLFNKNVLGTGDDIRYKFWVCSLENNTSFYFGVNNRPGPYPNGILGIPKLSSRSGIYISDSLFSSNLFLKGGFVFTYSSRIKSYYTSGIPYETDPAYVVDFTLAGRIRNSATIYFTWENLLDYKYFLIPYYPALGRNIRFGIAWDLLN
jgi:hypothetical protein